MKILSLVENNVSSDFYVGIGAGTKLLKDVREAQNSVKIVSPFLSKDLVNDLILSTKNNIKVELFTMDKIEDDVNKNNLKNLIIQNRIINQDLLKKCLLNIKINKFLNFLFLCSLVTIFIFLYKKISSKYILTLISGSIFILLYVFSNNIKNKNAKIYTYTYTPVSNFNFKIFVSPFNKEKKYIGTNRLNIHSKIYIIDSLIAYVGSLNLTSSGTKYNHETRVRTMNSSVVNKFNSLIDSFTQTEDYETIKIEELGQTIYDEKINDWI